MGGLSRRATILEQTQKAHTTFVVDAGDLTWKSSVVSSDRLSQQREKASLQFDVYTDGGIDAMVPGEGDLALGLDWLMEAATIHNLPYMAANLKCPDWPLMPGRIVERGGFRIAFIGVVGPKLAGPCAASSTIPAVSAAVASLGEADVYVLLSHQPAEEDEAIVRSVPEIDVVVNGHGRKQISRPVSLGGHAIQLAPGTRGKKLGIAEFQMVPGAKGFEVQGAEVELAQQIKTLEDRRNRARDRVAAVGDDGSRVRAEQRLRRLDAELQTAQAKRTSLQGAVAPPRNQVANQLAPLDESVKENAAVQDKLAVMKSRLETVKPVRSRSTPVKLKGPFVGDRACLGCHTEQHAQWKSTPHAYAWSTLIREQRSQDLDCWSCHVTGAHHPEGPQHPSEADGLYNVGCESCHGPGKNHVAGPSRANIVRNVSSQTCEQCHDGIKDEGRFEYEAYLKKVTH